MTTLLVLLVCVPMAEASVLRGAASGPADAMPGDPFTAEDYEAADFWNLHEPTLPDCRAPPAGDAGIPIVEVLARERANNPEVQGNCHFNWLTSCSVAHQTGDPFEFSRTYGAALAIGGGKNNSGWRDPKMATGPGVFLNDAEECMLGGWLDMPAIEREYVLHNYTALKERARVTCDAYADLTATATFNASSPPWTSVLEKLSSDEKVPAEERVAIWDTETMDRVQAMFCAFGALDCVIHHCLWSFCRLESCLIGTGRQCHSDWSVKLP